MTICLFECLRRVVAALYVQERNMKNNYNIMSQEPYMNQTQAATSKPRKAKGRGTPPPLELTWDANSRQAKGYGGEPMLESGGLYVHAGAFITLCR